MSAAYVVKPKADADLEDYSDYLTDRAVSGMDLRFLEAARETFSLLAAHPQMGWKARLKHRDLGDLRVFRVSGFEHMLILYRPLPMGVEILRVVHGSRNVRALFRRRGEME